MPEPMIAPMPSAVSDHGPSVLLRRCSGFSDSEINLSMDLQQKAWLVDVRMTASVGLAAGSVGGGDKGSLSPRRVSRAWVCGPCPGFVGSD